MRILILPFVIILLCCSVSGFAQPGTDCTTAFDIGSTCSTPATISATTGAQIGAACGASSTRRVTYLKFVAGATCPAISFDVTGGAGFQVVAYSGCPDVAGNLVAGSTACFSGASTGVWSTSAPLTNGATYYLRVWTNSTAGTIRACNISANANALDISGACSSVLTGTAATTTGAPIGTCAGSGQRNVTWFKFTADRTCPMLSIDNSNSTTAAQIANEVSLFSACGNANAILTPSATTCVASGSVVWTPPAGSPLTVGATYYLRIWTNTTSSGAINICNVPNVAQEMPLNGACDAYDLSYSTSGGTVSTIATCPSGTPNRRITWIKFHTTSANQCVTVNVTNKDINTDAGIRTEVALYNGGCGAAVVNNTSLCMADGVGVWSAGPAFPNNGYTPGTDYYLRVYADVAPDGSYQPITLCGTQKAQAINDECSSASAFNYTPGTYNNACAHYSGTPEGLTSTTANSAKICAFSLQNTVWYKFKVRDDASGPAGPATVRISNIDCDSYSGASQLLQMGLLSGTCGSLNAAGNAPPATGAPSAFPTNNTPGAGATSCLAASGTGPYNLYTSNTVHKDDIIYLAIDGYSGANCKFTLQASQNIQPIPIHLKYFTAWKNKSTNLVRWVTSYEHNNAYFDIERSTDAKYFESIGRVPGSESNTDKVYDFDDKFPPAVAYYRLKQVDLDGKFTYSDIIQVTRNENISFSVSAMPNPVQNIARVAISTPNTGNVSLRIVDAAGRQLRSEIIAVVKGNNLVSKDFSRLPAGTYYIAIAQDDLHAVKTFVKQ